MELIGSNMLLFFFLFFFFSPSHCPLSTLPASMVTVSYDDAVAAARAVR